MSNDILDFAYSLRNEVIENKSDYANKINLNEDFRNGFLDALDEIIFNFGDTSYDNKYRTEV